MDVETIWDSKLTGKEIKFDNILEEMRKHDPIVSIKALLNKVENIVHVNTEHITMIWWTKREYKEKILEINISFTNGQILTLSFKEENKQNTLDDIQLIH